MKFIQRTLASVIENASATFKCVLLSGPRQVGKTTLLKALAAKNRRFVTLDDPSVRALAKRDPKLFLATYPAPVLIDEIQYAPELFPYIKMAVDASEETGLFWLTGSQPFRLMKNVSESLAGRVAILTLQGLSEAERTNRSSHAFLPRLVPATDAGWSTKADAAEVIFRGSFPQLAAQASTDVGLFMSSYTATYLSRDIRDLVKVEHEHEFLTFLKCLALRTGQLLNASNLAQDVGVSAPTIRSWVSLLESSGLIVLLQPYRTNLTKRAIATPKVYFLDTGLAANLCGFRSSDEILGSPLWGHLFETYVVSEVLKSWWHAGLDCRASFYRDKEGHEIDLLIEDATRICPIEIKSSAEPNLPEIESNLEALRSTGTRLSLGAVICLARPSQPFSSSLIGLNAALI